MSVLLVNLSYYRYKSEVDSPYIVLYVPTNQRT